MVQQQLLGALYDLHREILELCLRDILSQNTSFVHQAYPFEHVLLGVDFIRLLRLRP